MGTSGTSAQHPREREGGSAVIIVMMFVLVMLGLGAALFIMVRSSIWGTELERKEVKAFNVAEAGVDAGMLALKLDWPKSSTIVPTVDVSQIRAEFPVDQFRNPRDHSTGATLPDKWLQVALYDNSSGSPSWDANRDFLMFVDSEANVDNDRHRIILLAKRHCYPLEFPLIAMFAGSAGGNGHGLRVYVDPEPQTTPFPTTNAQGEPAAPAIWGGELGKGLDIGPNIKPIPNSTDTFNSFITPAMMVHLERIAKEHGTYFDDKSGTEWADIAAAQAFLTSADAPGCVIWIESAHAIELAANTQIGTRDDPVILVLDTPSNVNNGLDFRGTADFFGIVINTGGTIVRGTSGFFGSVISKGVVEAKGTGTIPEVNYNGDVISKFSDYYTLSVAIEPNTWEEYTVPDTTGTTGG